MPAESISAEIVLAVEVEGQKLAQIEDSTPLLAGQAGLFSQGDDSPYFSDFVVRSAPRDPVLEWTFITSQFEGMVEQLDSFNGEALQIDATPVDKARLAAAIEAAATGMARAAGTLAQARLALAGAGADELPARRLAAQQAAASQQTEAAAQFDAVYSLIFQGSYRPTLPQVEISAITGKGQRLALLLESPEPMDWTRLACKLQVLKSSGVYTDLKDILLVWNEDGTKLLLLPTNRPTVPGESLRLHFAYTLDLGAEAPVQRRNGSTLPEVAALHFVLA